jgi:hypothetical protein
MKSLLRVRAGPPLLVAFRSINLIGPGKPEEIFDKLLPE